MASHSPSNEQKIDKRLTNKACKNLVNSLSFVECRSDVPDDIFDNLHALQSFMNRHGTEQVETEINFRFLCLT